MEGCCIICPEHAPDCLCPECSCSSCDAYNHGNCLEAQARRNKVKITVSHEKLIIKTTSFIEKDKFQNLLSYLKSTPYRYTPETKEWTKTFTNPRFPEGVENILKGMGLNIEH
jgi:hypothetical protein